jgi:dolichyl-phosphate beta-glucosyltransferase
VAGTIVEPLAAPVQLSIVIPAYNEAVRLPRSLDDTLRFLSADSRRSEVIVVDDGSTDGTAEFVRSVARRDDRVRLVSLPENRGKGCAVRTGVLLAAGERILFTDADGSTPIAELYRLESSLTDGSAIAIGSRESVAAGVTVDSRIYRRVAGRIFHLFVRTVALTGVRDTQCGFKLLRADAARALFSQMRMDDYSFDIELLLRARRAGYRIAEVGVNWTHQPGSKTRMLRDGTRMTYDLFRIRALLLSEERAERARRMALE